MRCMGTPITMKHTSAQVGPERAVAPGCRSQSSVPVWRLAVFVGCVVAAAALAAWLLPVRVWLEAVIQWTEGFGVWAVLIFALLYALMATAAVPTTPLTVAAGLLFGPVMGAAVAVCGGMTAAVLSFLISRYWLGDRLRQRLACHRRLRTFMEAVEGAGWKVVLLTRLNPVVPASVKSYGFGMTRIPLRVYATATLAAQAPFAFAVAYLGAAGRLSLAGPAGRPHLFEYSLYGAGVLATLALTALVVRHLRRQPSRQEHAD